MTLPGLISSPLLLWQDCSLSSDLGMHGPGDHRAYEHDADEEATEDRRGYKKIDGSHGALRR
jgi:hypothetical protein